LALAADERGGRVIVANPDDNTVSFFDATWLYTRARWKEGS